VPKELVRNAGCLKREGEQSPTGASTSTLRGNRATEQANHPPVNSQREAERGKTRDQRKGYEKPTESLDSSVTEKRKGVRT